jgi:hypothetical protein
VQSLAHWGSFPSLAVADRLALGGMDPNFFGSRNLFEVSVIFFVICMASQLRALTLEGSQASVAGKGGMAA